MSAGATSRRAHQASGALAAVERAAFAFAASCADPKRDLNSLIVEFHDAINLGGFSCAAMGGGMSVDADGAWKIYFNSLPQRWNDLIKERGLLGKGLPGNTEVFRHIAPFDSGEAARNRPLTALEQEMVDLTDAFGWGTNISIPILGPHGYRASLHISAMRQIEVTPRLRAALWLLGLHLHERCYTETDAPALPRDPGLTWRELECLQHVAAGLSDKQIARRIGISPETVGDHIARGRRKLRANSRIGAVAMLTLMGKTNTTAIKTHAVGRAENPQG
jgi:DNA-binding CsgD family transcriptional regulator